MSASTVAATGESPAPATVSCIIASSPRTGSQLLARTIAATGVGGRPYETLQPAPYERFARKQRRAVSFAEYRDHCLDRATTDNGVRTTTVKINALRWLVTKERFASGDVHAGDIDVLERLFPNPHWVYLHREDTARQAISWYRALTTEVWLAPADSPDVEERSVPDPDWPRVRWLDDVAREHDRRWREFFAVNRIDPLVIAYEELQHDVVSVVRRILGSLGVEVPAEFADYTPELHQMSDDVSDRWLEIYRAKRDDLPPSPWAS
jgi:LPS sulfotransferase NodH